MCVFFLALSPYRKTMRDGESASKPNPHIFAQLSRMRKQLATCYKKLFLRVDKIVVKKLGKAPKGIVGKYPIVRMLAFQCGCAMLLISTSAWPLSRKSATPNNVVPTKDKKYAHYSWISGRCRLAHTDERKHKVTEKVGSPFNAALVSFLVGLLFLSTLLLVTGQGLHIPFAQLLNEPAWIWIGGICGVVFLTGNILLFPKLGGVQTVVLPVLGQILMGLTIDNFGLFYSQQTSLTAFRIAGAVLVLLGVVLVSTAKESKAERTNRQKSAPASLWLWRAFSVFSGMAVATQTAVNGYLGVAAGSPIKASVISFAVGIILLAIICIVLRVENGKPESKEEKPAKNPWWMWIGGILGGLYVLANVYLSRIIGTGMTVVVLLVGSTTGGILVDHFGIFESPKKAVNKQKILGVLIMILGAAAIKLL